MKDYYRVWAEIDLDAVYQNAEEMRRITSQSNEQAPLLCGVVKTDGYGHGAVPIAQAIEPLVWGYAVATVEEALQLREHGIENPILILGFVNRKDYFACIRYGIRVTLYDAADIEEMCKAVNVYREKSGEKAARLMLHLKLDTGMGRIGFLVTSEEQLANSVEDICVAAKAEELYFEGCFTHFSKADETDKTFAETQHERFLRALDSLKERGVTFEICHCNNSAGIIDFPQWGAGMVRMGISLYGLYPSEEVDKTVISLHPALELKSHIIYIKTVPEGMPISYGGTFVTKRETLVGTVPVGYGDGYPRNLSNKGYVLVRGKKAPILGRVCMDQFMVDLTDIPQAKQGDLVTLVGRDGGESICVEELAKLAGTFNYEFVCNLGKRIPRVFLQNGVAIGSKDYFEDDYGDF